MKTNTVEACILYIMIASTLARR